MQILVSLSDTGTQEWGLVELQGQLETRDQISFDSMHIGSLHFDSNSTPNLIIGHHLLTGRVVDLEKAIAVLQKTSRSTSVDEDSDSEKKSIQHKVVAIIRKKIIFKYRPKPIITKTLPKSN